MVSLRIGSNTLSGLLKIKTTGTVTSNTETGENTRDGFVTLEAPAQPSYDSWYASVLTKKTTAMMFGGTSSSDSAGDGKYYFETGYIGLLTAGDDSSASRTPIMSINGIFPDSAGSIVLLPSKTLDVSLGPVEDNPHAVFLSLPIHHIRINKLYQELDLLIWRMYHAINSISGRLQLWAPSLQPDGIPEISTMGRYLGTYLNYQAIVSRWNHYAWSNTFTLTVVEAGERLSIAIGYTNLECRLDTPVTYSLTVTFDSNIPDTEQIEYATELTIYNQGVDSTLISENYVASTTFTRNGEVVSGSGYEGAEPTELVSVGVETQLTKPAGSGAPIFLAEQHYRNIIAVAPCIGVDKEYVTQTGTPTDFHTVRIDAEWVVHGEVYRKTTTAKIAAVGYEIVEEDANK